MFSRNRDHRDLIGGVMLICVGLFAAVYSTSTYRLGTIERMGPGMVPMILGYVMAGLGVILLVRAPFRVEGEAEKVAWRPLAMITLSVTVFALTIDRLGLLPAVLLMTVCSVLADRKLQLLGGLALGVVLATIAILVFVVGLSIPVSIIDLPW